MMHDWEIWVTIFALVLATVLTRSAFWMLGRHVVLPKRVQEALRYAPACALAAIIVPDLLFDSGALHLAWSNHKLLAAAGAVAFYLLKRDMLLTILVGMILFTALRLYF
jgi:branched-subunit amino acid transport protein